MQQGMVGLLDQPHPKARQTGWDGSSWRANGESKGAAWRTVNTNAEPALLHVELALSRCSRPRRLMHVCYRSVVAVFAHQAPLPARRAGLQQEEGLPGHGEAASVRV